MTLPGPPPQRPQTTVERIAQLERTVRAMQAAPKLSTTRDQFLYGDAISTCPRTLIQNSGASMALNVPRAVLLYTPVPTSFCTRISFAVQNSSVSAATMGVAVYCGTDPTALFFATSGSTAITASVADYYSVPLIANGPAPAGYILLVAQATAVGATVPQLALAGQAPVNVYVGNDPAAGLILTTLVGATTMTPWPSNLSVATSNTAVWSQSTSAVWLALG